MRIFVYLFVYLYSSLSDWEGKTGSNNLYFISCPPSHKNKSLKTQTCMKYFVLWWCVWCVVGLIWFDIWQNYSIIVLTYCIPMVNGEIKNHTFLVTSPFHFYFLLLHLHLAHILNVYIMVHSIERWQGCSQLLFLLVVDLCSHLLHIPNVYIVIHPAHSGDRGE